jgi:hypothetical protein
MIGDMEKSRQALLGVIWLAAVAVSLVLSEPLSQDPSRFSRSPNLMTGQTIPLSIRGTGTIYRSPEEWHKLVPFWYFFNVNIFGGCLFAIGSTVFRITRERRQRRRRMIAESTRTVVSIWPPHPTKPPIE